MAVFSFQDLDPDLAEFDLHRRSEKKLDSYQPFQTAAFLVVLAIDVILIAIQRHFRSGTPVLR